MRKIENGGFSFNAESCSVVGSGGHFGCGESAEPNPRFLARLADFGHPLSPISHANAPVDGVFVGVTAAFKVVTVGALVLD